MAIVYCSECGKQVSELATACPHCGNPRTVAPAAVAPVKKKSHPILIILGVAGVLFLLLIIVVVILVANARPAPAANFVALDNITDTNCTQITDYCINVYCTYQNRGNAAGERRVRAQLIDKTTRDVRADHFYDLTLLPNDSQRVNFTFPEAELDWQVSSICSIDAGP